MYAVNDSGISDYGSESLTALMLFSFSTEKKDKSFSVLDKGSNSFDNEIKKLLIKITEDNTGSCRQTLFFYKWTVTKLAYILLFQISG